jgi:hypothetical protein
MSYYPPDFQSWPLEKRNAWFATEASSYREKTANGAAAEWENPGALRKAAHELARPFVGGQARRCLT